MSIKSCLLQHIQCLRRLFFFGCTLVVFYCLFLTSTLQYAIAEQTALPTFVFTPLTDELEPLQEQPQPDQQWHLTADKVSTLNGNAIVEAEGAVILTRGNDVLKADFARYFAETDWVYLHGNVFVRLGRDDIRAKEAEFDLRSQTGWLVDGDVFIEGQHTYFKGQEIVKHRGDRYTFKNAKVTTCDTDVPAWSVSAQEVIVEIDGYAQLYHSDLQIKDHTFFYTPFLILPAKTTRQSGLLVPDYGIGTKRGVYYTQPYYWVLDESRDITFYAGVMSERGFMPGFEYRSHPFNGEKTWFAASGFYDSESITAPGSDLFNAGLLRTNQERFWVRGMSDGFFGSSGWQYRINIDYTSDQNYLREFNTGPMGFERSRNEMFALFGRDIAEDDQNRISEALLFKEWQRASLYAGFRYEQNPALGHGNTSTDTLVQELPNVSAFLYKGRIFSELPLELEGFATSAYMHRQSGTSGFRNEVYPKISVPLDLGLFSFIGSLGLRQTWYTNTSTSDNSPLNLDSGGSPPQYNQTRFLPDLDISGYTVASRVWHFADSAALESKTRQAGDAANVALRHEVQSNIRYQYISHINQENNPFYTDSDRILPQNELTWSFTNIFTQKNGKVVAVEQDPTQTTLNYTYIDLARWKIEWGYDFNEATRTDYLNLFPRRPFQDIYSELDLHLVSWASLFNKLYVSPYDAEITRANLGFNVFVPSRFSWTTGFDYRTDAYDYRRLVSYGHENNVVLSNPTRYWLNTLSITFSPQWSVELMDRRNLLEGTKTFGEAYEQSARVIFSDQCYRLIAEYRYDNYERSYSLMVEIPGLFD